MAEQTVRCRMCTADVAMNEDGIIERHDGVPGNLCPGSGRPAVKAL